MRRHEYKSLNGCCVCRCKSSTSRFAKSDVWEKYFTMCFLLPPKQRTGDICNACVLVVKRFCKKKKETTFEYVVDCRSGPGSKSMAKIKKRRKQIGTSTETKEQTRTNIEYKTGRTARKQNKNKIYRTLHQPSQLHMLNNVSTRSTYPDLKQPFNQSSSFPPSSLSSFPPSSLSSFPPSSLSSFPPSSLSSFPPSSLSSFPPQASSSYPPSASLLCDDVSWEEIWEHSISPPKYLGAHFKGYKLCCGVLYLSLKTGEVICRRASYHPCSRHLRLAYKHLSSSPSSSSSPPTSSSFHSSSLPASPLSQFDDENSSHTAMNEGDEDAMIEEDEDGRNEMGGDGDRDEMGGDGDRDEMGGDGDRDEMGGDGDRGGDNDVEEGVCGENVGKEGEGCGGEEDGEKRVGVVEEGCYRGERLSFDTPSLVPMCF